MLNRFDAEIVGWTITVTVGHDAPTTIVVAQGESRVLVGLSQIDALIDCLEHAATEATK
jgi:hypothetical protein